MKIMNRKEFISLPSGVVYSEYQSSGMINGLYLKGNSLPNDWYYQDLIGDVDAENDTAMHDLFEEAEKGKEFELDLECGRRDGGFEDSEMFAVYDKKDIYKLIGRLSGIVEELGD